MLINPGEAENLLAPRGLDRGRWTAGATLIGHGGQLDRAPTQRLRAVPGLVYRTRKTLEAQAAALTLDASTNDVSNPLEPVRDTSSRVAPPGV